MPFKNTHMRSVSPLISPRSFLWGLGVACALCVPRSSKCSTLCSAWTADLSVHGFPGRIPGVGLPFPLGDLLRSGLNPHLLDLSHWQASSLPCTTCWAQLQGMWSLNLQQDQTWALSSRRASLNHWSRQKSGSGVMIWLRW